MSVQLQPHRNNHNQSLQQTKFQINNLPLELYLEILSHLSSFSETLSPSQETAHLPLHLPFSAPLFHNSLLFTFSCLDILRRFAGCFDRGRDVRRVRILYDSADDEGRSGERKEERSMEKKKGDWVFVLFECFEKLEEITFVKTMEMKDGDCSEDEERWWQDIKSAVREGLSMRSQMGGVVMLKVENGNGWGKEEKIVYT